MSLSNRQIIKLLAAAFFLVSALVSYEVAGTPRHDAPPETKQPNDMSCVYYRDATRPACTPK